MMNSFKRASDFNPSLVIGPIQVCGLLSAALFGCLACQSYLYFARFRNDHLALKATVSAVILLQLGHFICIILMLWTMTVSTYGDLSQLAVLPLATDLLVPFSGLTVFIVQSFYAFRLWKLAGNIFLPIICQIFSVIAQISTFVFTAALINVTDFGNHEMLLIELAFVSRAVCDLITTAGIAWSLKKKRNPDIKNSATMVDRLIKWTIETGLVTSLMALALATWVSTLKQQDYLWTGFWLLWPGVVGNSLLISLNRRLFLRDRALRGDTQNSTFALSTVMFSTGATQSQPGPSENFKDRDLQV